MRNAIVTLISGDNISGAVALAHSAGIFSTSSLVCMVTQDVSDRGPLTDAYDSIVEVDTLPYGLTKWRCLSLDQYDRVLILDANMIIVAPVDGLFALPVPSSGKSGIGSNAARDGPVMLSPSKFAMDLFIREIESIHSEGANMPMDVITTYYRRHGYEWNTPIPEDRVMTFRDSRSMQSSSIWREMYRNTYLPTKPGLMSRLQDILAIYVGEDARDVVREAWPTFQQVFISKDVNPVSNYEFLEAIGDKFLGGYYMWVLVNTPGVITPDQVTKISNHFQDATRLAEVVQYLRLGSYIQAKNINDKVRSDIIEALIAAVGIAYERIHGNGDWAMRKLVTTLYRDIFEIDPTNYMLLYANPKERMNVLVQELYVDRSKLKESAPQNVRGKIVISVSYDGHLLGTGEASLDGVYRDTAIRNARNEAYRDALRANALQKYLRSIGEL